MTVVGSSLQIHREAHWSGQIQTAVHTGVAMGTLSEILQKDHIPRIETLFRLADHFGTDRIERLFIVGHLQTADQLPRGQHAQPDKRDYLLDELVAEFQKVPDEWKQEVIAQTRMFVRLANRPPFRVIGDDTEPEPAGAEEDEHTEKASQPIEAPVA